MGASHRAEKVADRIKVVVAQTLENKVKDPRLGFITITDVRITGDLQQASVFYTVLGDDEAKSATAAALKSAKGLLRSEVGKDLGMRITPTLEFFSDGLSETVKQFDDLMARVHQQDAELEVLRKGAQPIATDPYKPHKTHE